MRSNKSLELPSGKGFSDFKVKLVQTPVKSNPVESSSLKGHYFTLTTLPEHTLKGKAHHGIVRDVSGFLWLFQYGEGLDQNQEALTEQLANYPMAEEMWEKMAENIRSKYLTSTSK